MSATDELVGDSERLRAVAAQARRGLVERELLVEAVILCAVAGEHLLVVGPPGTAKSPGGAAGRRPVWADATSSTCWAASPSRTRCSARWICAGCARASWRSRRPGMLPEAEVAFLDEVFLRVDRDPEHAAGHPERAHVPAREHGDDLPACGCASVPRTCCRTIRRWRRSPTGSWPGCSWSRSRTPGWRSCWKPVGRAARSQRPGRPAGDGDARLGGRRSGPRALVAGLRRWTACRQPRRIVTCGRSSRCWRRRSGGCGRPECS